MGKFSDFLNCYRTVSCVFAAIVFTFCLIILVQWRQIDSLQMEVDRLKESRVEVENRLNATQRMLNEERRNSFSSFQWTSR